MLAPKNWLSDFVSLSGISDEQFAREMTFAGNKVESVQKVNGELVYEFEITSNRPDTLSIIGLAREAAAIFDRPLKLPKTPQKKSFKRTPISLTAADKKICPVFSIVEIENVIVKQSSKLVQKRLKLSGIRPVNAIVDITNYLMLETGQPMHAFDADKLKGSLILRPARAREKITPLDHKERELRGGEIIIEDHKELIDLAGLMGGLNSEISETTKRVCLLVPIYDPVVIRRASKYLRIRTEASTRFEKKLDLTQTEDVALRAIELLEKETGGKQVTVVVTRVNAEWVAPKIVLSEEKVSALVGLSFTKEQIENYLSKVGIYPDIARSQFTLSPSKGGNLMKTDRHGRQGDLAMTFVPPSWRRDIAIPVDLIEEVTRLYGYNKLPRTLPVGQIPINTDALTPNWKRIVAEQCAALGYTETYSSTLIGKSLIEELGFFQPAQHLKVLHPMSEDFEYMRRTTLETLIPFLKQNLNETNAINIFELGTVFTPTEKSSDLPDQPLELGLISTTSSYAQFKGQIENIGKTLGVSFEFSSGRHSQQRVGIAMTDIVFICLNKVTTGQIGKISSAYAGCLNMTEIFKHATKAFVYPQLSGYPPIIEDLTVERPAGKFLGEAIEMMKHISPLVYSVDYLSEYQQFVSLRLTYQLFDRSLTQEEVSVVRKDLLKKLESMGWILKS